MNRASRGAKRFLTWLVRFRRHRSPRRHAGLGVLLGVSKESSNILYNDNKEIRLRSESLLRTTPAPTRPVTFEKPCSIRVFRETVCPIPSAEMYYDTPSPGVSLGGIGHTPGEPIPPDAVERCHDSSAEAARGALLGRRLRRAVPDRQADRVAAVGLQVSDQGQGEAPVHRHVSQRDAGPSQGRPRHRAVATGQRRHPHLSQSTRKVSPMCSGRSVTYVPGRTYAAVHMERSSSPSDAGRPEALLSLRVPYSQRRSRASCSQCPPAMSRTSVRSAPGAASASCQTTWPCAASCSR